MSGPQIVVLDGHVLNPGDLSWQGLAALGSLTVHDRTPPELVRERASGAPIVLTNKVHLDAATLTALADLRFVSVLATGYDVVDVAAARARGVVVANVPEYGTASVAQHTIALLLELASRVGMHDDAVHAGDWIGSPDFCFWRESPVELAGLTLGVIGYGRIGRRVATVARALGMSVIASVSPEVDPTQGARGTGRETAVDSAQGPSQVPSAGLGINPASSAESSAPIDVPRLAVEEVFARADAITLHCPATAQNRGFVNEALLRSMKPTAWLLNTGRGVLIDEAALARALREGWIAGAAVDVLVAEPMAADSPLRDAPRLIVTPHIAWASLAARRRLMEVTVRNVAAFLAGAPVNVVR